MSTHGTSVHDVICSWQSSVNIGSPSIRQLILHIKQQAIPEYFRGLGVSEANIPEFFIQAWAAVSETENDAHVVHEHFSNGNALCSGVFYAQAPQGSGPLRFSDIRKTASYRYSNVPDNFFPGANYDYTPVTGYLLLFPPWASHEVLPSPYGSEGPGDRARVVWAFNALVLAGASGSGHLPVLTRDLFDLKIKLPNGSGE